MNGGRLLNLPQQPAWQVFPHFFLLLLHELYEHWHLLKPLGSQGHLCWMFFLQTARGPQGHQCGASSANKSWVSASGASSSTSEGLKSGVAGIFLAIIHYTI